MRETKLEKTNKKMNPNNKEFVEKLTAIFLLLAVFINLSIGVAAQSSGGSYAVTKSVVANGGTGNAQQSSGGAFAVVGTIAQSIADNGASGGNYVLNSGFWSPTLYNVGLEGDIVARPNGGDGVKPNDVILAQRLINGTATVDPEYNEFQRADTAPRATFGDGKITASDIVQTIRYLNQTDAAHTAAGPAEKSGAARSADDEKTENASLADRAIAAPRVVRVESTNAVAGQPVTVNIRVDAVGDEAAYAFIINYDKTKLLNPIIGAGNTGAATRSCNVNYSTGINCYVGAFPNDNPNSTDHQIGEIAAGNNQILITVTFTVAANVSSPVSLTLSDVSASNDNADDIPVSGTNGTVSVSGGPTAAPVSVGGQILTADGRGIRNVQVTMTDARGQSQTVLSAINGRFRFDNVPAGEVYIFAVSAKRFEFAQDRQILMINEDTDNINFVAAETLKLPMKMQN